MESPMTVTRVFAAVGFAVADATPRSAIRRIEAASATTARSSGCRRSRVVFVFVVVCGACIGGSGCKLDVLFDVGLPFLLLFQLLVLRDRLGDRGLGRGVLGCRRCDRFGSSRRLLGLRRLDRGELL